MHRVTAATCRVRGSAANRARVCPLELGPPANQYAYLLGQYLGDGWIGKHPRGVFRLTITCANAYPHIVIECAQAMSAVLPENVIGQRARASVIDVNCYSKHLPCLFPQHGTGLKHERPIALQSWQEEIALQVHPGQFLRGLIHSDGCRSINRVQSPTGKSYEYPRYTFSNRSSDIRGLFCAACNELQIEWRQMNHCTISVARRASVARLDAIVGPKT